MPMLSTFGGGSIAGFRSLSSGGLFETFTGNVKYLDSVGTIHSFQDNGTAYAPTGSSANVNDNLGSTLGHAMSRDGKHLVAAQYSDGSIGYTKLNTAWDLSNQAVNMSVSSSQINSWANGGAGGGTASWSTPSGAFYTENGQYLCVVDRGNENRVTIIELLSPFEISSSNIGAVTMSPGPTIASSVNGLGMSRDGTKIVLGNQNNEDVESYALSTAYDASSMASSPYSTNATVMDTVSNMLGFFVQHDGRYVYGTGFSWDGKIVRAEMSTPWLASSISRNSRVNIPVGLSQQWGGSMDQPSNINQINTHPDEDKISISCYDGRVLIYNATFAGP